jgi:cytoskeletal protein RodZ
MFVTEPDTTRGAHLPGWAVSIQIGEALWRGRIRAGLSVDDIARRVGADRETIRALENSDFASLPSREKSIAAARAYAQIIGLSKKWVTSALDKELTQVNE